MDQGKTLPNMNLLNQGGNKKMTKKKKRKITIIDQGKTLPDMNLLNQGDGKKMTKKEKRKVTKMDQGKTLPDMNILDQEGNKKMAKKKKKRKIISSETHRFELSLEIIQADENSKTQYPEFNWLDLVDKKKASETEVVEQKEVIDPISGDDTDAITREIDVIKLEESFENTIKKTKKKKSKKVVNDNNKQFETNAHEIESSKSKEKSETKIQKTNFKKSKKTGEIALFSKGRIAKNLKTWQGGFYVKQRYPNLKIKESTPERPSEFQQISDQNSNSDSDVETLLARLMSDVTTMVSQEKNI